MIVVTGATGNRLILISASGINHERRAAQHVIRAARKAGVGHFVQRERPADVIEAVLRGDKS